MEQQADLLVTPTDAQVTLTERVVPWRGLPCRLSFQSESIKQLQLVGSALLVANSESCHGGRVGVAIIRIRGWPLSQRCHLPLPVSVNDVIHPPPQ